MHTPTHIIGLKELKLQPIMISHCLAAQNLNLMGSGGARQISHCLAAQHLNLKGSGGARQISHTRHFQHNKWSSFTRGSSTDSKIQKKTHFVVHKSIQYSNGKPRKHTGCTMMWLTHPTSITLSNRFVVRFTKLHPACCSLF